ncbi:MAG: hypothetical protein A2600_13225 [Candidatus Lambdaproteobacteria bacterium RIFOXYD1_FULL_56_27]|uniref:Tyr recombinase domain-containing protein n=1 Tax=Candidatus Lambdaproteobacteria bacterium RIFOXYD2_FULL_56_26 TaxID=1817773 RepID=A0A1F6GLL1_9PROT|nr:MAG: hypothetical protein A2557_01260 [Candidatus Lambdaproteobacteria bacterium RIFOXYD2_FULL_56_26]OGH03421.1 MAG: hypothetical protein A2426_03030 [Candidatus Lambdaproteobacteria bacterium RIFOXYC1_FULL_56_13]OGH08903.1 MAG: hypothetical protein A2600_13225 [Candidatus Lambdaproteobacteria bacterium RIFOXYD1_FULL_56_27]
MPRARTNWSVDEERGVLVGFFHELRKPGQTWTPRYDLCSTDEFAFKQTSRGKVRRSEKEQADLVARLKAEKLKALLAERPPVENVNRGRPIKELFQEWLDQVGSVRSVGTVRSYACTASLYLLIIGDHRIKDLSSGHLSRFMGELGKRKVKHDGTVQEYSPTSVYKHGRQLGTFFEWAVKEGHLDRVPEIVKPRLTKKEYRTLPNGAVDLIQSRLESDLLTPHNLVQQHSRINRLRAWVLIRYTGLRGGEVNSMLLENIDLEARVIKLRDNLETGFKIKGRKERALPIVPALVEFLERDLKERKPQERYFLDNGTGRPYFSDLSPLARGISKIINELGIKGVKPLHGLRGTVFTELAQAGVDTVTIQKIAGHTEIETTRRYINAQTIDMEQALRKLPNRGRIGDVAFGI